MNTSDSGQLLDGENDDDGDAEDNLDSDALSKEAVALLENLGNILTVVTKEHNILYVRNLSFYKNFTDQVEGKQDIRLTFITKPFPDEVIQEAGIPVEAAHAMESDCELTLRAPRPFSSRKDSIVGKWHCEEGRKSIFILKIPFAGPDEDAPIRFTS